MILIRAIQLQDGEAVKLKQPSFEQVEELITSWEFSWVDLDITDAPEKEVVELLVNRLKFHPLTAEDCYARLTFMPKADDYEDYQFFIFHYFIINKQGEVEARELNVFVGRNYVITVHRKELHEFRHQLMPIPENIHTSSEKAMLFLHHILDVIIEAYLSELTHVQKMADDIENMILAGESVKSRLGARKLVRYILALRQSVTVMRRSVQAERVIIGGLIRSQRPREEEEEAEVVRYFNDLLDQLDRAIEILGQERDALTNIMDLHMTLVTDRTNEIIRILTVISAIILPLNLVAGIYGMNFENMPELGHPAAYYLVLLFMVVLSVGLIVFFRKRGWI